jgi:hypothetical protein
MNEDKNKSLLISAEKIEDTNMDLQTPRNLLEIEIWFRNFLFYKILIIFLLLQFFTIDMEAGGFILITIS